MKFGDKLKDKLELDNFFFMAIYGENMKVSFGPRLSEIKLKPKEYNLSLLLRFKERIPVFGELSELYKLVGVYPDH